jgi:hypothetical protein
MKVGAGQQRLDARRLDHRHAADVEAMHDGGDARQRGIVVQAEACRQYFERDPAADMGEGRMVKIETKSRLRTLLRIVQPKKCRLPVDEAADQPGRSHAINPQVFARGPASDPESRRWRDGEFCPRLSRLIAGCRFKGRKRRLCLPLRLAGKIVDGDQRRQITAQAAQMP